MVRYEVTDNMRVTEIGMRLSLEETRGEAIDQIVALYRELRDVRKVAKRLEVGKTTLNNWIARIPALKEAIEKARQER